MFKGFYNLTSGMLTQQRNLNVIANNITNVSTAGYKAETYTSSTFDEVLYSRVGNEGKVYQELGPVSYIRATSEIYSDFTQGSVEQTGYSLDFAIQGEGFFAIRGANGQVSYTRSGEFTLDEDGYLCLGGYGRVLGANGQEILLMTDKVHGDESGYIYLDNGTPVAQLGVYVFDDNAQLERNEQGMFTGAGAQLNETPTVLWSYVERSNVNLVDQMTEMLSSQRALQSAAQVAKMYDDLMTKASTEVGRLQ